MFEAILFIAGLIIALLADLFEMKPLITGFFILGVFTGGLFIATTTVVTKSEKGYNVFPVYEVSGKDTINTTWYVREKH